MFSLFPLKYLQEVLVRARKASWILAARASWYQPMAHRTTEKLREIYQRLLGHFGQQAWWPAQTPFEVMVGAVLTQNTNWRNVERAIDNLRRAGLLSFPRLAALPVSQLAEYIRPAGYYNIKASRLHSLFSSVQSDYQGDLDRLFAEPAVRLRQWLLSVKGIGPETADSIMLYAAGKPIFVVDAYTHRVLLRHALICEESGYQEIQELFMDNLEPDVSLFNEYHALLVQVGKFFCRKTGPRCEACPLQGI